MVHRSSPHLIILLIARHTHPVRNRTHHSGRKGECGCYVISRLRFIARTGIIRWFLENGNYAFHSTRLLDRVLQKVASTHGGKGTLDLQPPPGFGILTTFFACRKGDPQSGLMTSVSFYAGQGAWEDNVSRRTPRNSSFWFDHFRKRGGCSAAIWQLDAAGATAAAKSIFATPVPGSNAKLAAGDVAQVIVRSPFAGRLLLSVETDDVVSTRVVEMPASHMAVPIAIPGACRPNAYITATVIRASTLTRPGKRIARWAPCVCRSTIPIGSSTFTSPRRRRSGRPLHWRSV